MSETQLQNRPLRIPAAITALMLFGALASWPYGYYQFLRLVVCAVAAYVTFMAYNWRISWATYLFGIIAVLFNPLVPIHLSRKIWQTIDVVCAALFVVIAIILKEPAQSSEGHKTIHEELKGG